MESTREKNISVIVAILGDEQLRLPNILRNYFAANFRRLFQYDNQRPTNTSHKMTLC